MPMNYNYYVRTVVHQWALVNGYSGANRISLRAWMRLPHNERRDFRQLILGGTQL
jgi:hypothetical protein